MIESWLTRNYYFNPYYIYIRVLKIFSKSFFSIFFWYYISSRFYKISVDETTSLSILEYHHLHDFRTKRELNLLDLNPRSYQFIILINYFSSRRNFSSFMRSFKNFSQNLHRFNHLLLEQATNAIWYLIIDVLCVHSGVISRLDYQYDDWCSPQLNLLHIWWLFPILYDFPLNLWIRKWMKE